MRTVVFAVLLVPLLGCDDWPVGPGGPADSFTYAISGPGVDPAPAPSVAVEIEGLVIRGAIDTPTPCFELASRVAREGQRIEVTVTARRRGNNPCIQIVGRLAYELVVSGLNPGPYDVVVYHAFAGRGGRRVGVLETEIAVP